MKVEIFKNRFLKKIWLPAGTSCKNLAVFLKI
jgi:hypothetical protein